MYKRTGWGFAIIALILGGCLYFLTTGRFILGIDLRGGTELTYELDLSRVEEQTATAAEQVKTVVANRLDIYGLKEISIAVQGENRLVVQLPGAQDSQDVAFLKQQIEQAGNLMFMLRAPDDEQTEPRIKEVQEEEAKYLALERAWIAKKKEHDARLIAEKKDPADSDFEKIEKRPQAPEFIARPEMESYEDAQGRPLLKEKRNQWQHLQTVLHNGEQYKVSGRYLSRAHETYDEQGKPAVAFSFNPEGALKFGELTGPHVNRYLVIVLDDHIRQQAQIRSKISESGQLTGNFSRKDVQGIVTILRGGSLSTKPQLISESTVGAVLGNDSIRSGALAVTVGLLGILAFMAIYYFVGGMVANLALVLNVIAILAFVVVFRQTLTFPGIAGILLTIGMAVDANILIFERVREELARGKSLLHSLSTGYQRAFWVIFDCHVTTILTGIVLFNFGSGPVKGFAITLVAGLVASFFTAVYVTRIILSALYNVGFLKRLRMMRIFAPPRVDFVANRWFVSVSVIVIVATWALFVIPRGSHNYGIDFTGGSRVTMNLSRIIDVSELRGLVDGLPADEKSLFKDYAIQTLNAGQEGKASSFSLLTRTEEEDSVAHAQEKPKDAAPPAATPPAVAPPPPAPVQGSGEKPAAPPPAAPAPAPAPAGPESKAAPEAPAAERKLPSQAPARAENVDQPRSTAEARRVDVLKRMLARDNLLLPDPFSESKWEDVGPAGAQRLVLEANVTQVSPEFNKVRDDQGTEKTLATPEAMKERLNAYLSKHPDLKIRGTETGDWKGIRVESVQAVGGAGTSGLGAVEVLRYRITIQPYTEPPPGVDEATRAQPRHPEVISEIKGWFRKGASNLLTLSDPIPEVLSVGPKVARDLQAGAIIAVFISMLGIMFFLALRFELMYGLAGIVALAHDVLITIGIMAMTDALMGQTFSIKINLAEIAAFLTIIGFSINDTIVVFDRIREILRTPKLKLSYEEVVNAAVNQTLSRTIWTSLTTLITTLALLLFGGEPVRGFAYAFAIGIVTGTYSSIFVANPIVVYLHARQLKRREALLAEAAMKS